MPRNATDVVIGSIVDCTCVQHSIEVTIVDDVVLKLHLGNVPQAAATGYCKALQPPP